MIDFVRNSKTHLFVDDLNNQLVLTGDDYHHISRVLRVSAGEKITAANNGKIYEYVITEINRSEILTEKTGNHIEITEDEIKLACSLFNLQRLENGIQKAVESGVTQIYIGPTQRSSISLNEKQQEKTVARLKKIILNASMQSRRATLATIDYVSDLVEFCLAAENELILCDPDGSPDLEIRPGLFIIGPEGGFSDFEIEKLKDKAQNWSISPYVLRSETAIALIPGLVSFLHNREI